MTFTIKGVKKQITKQACVYSELFLLFGFSFYKYFVLMKSLGYSGFNRRDFSIFTLNKLYWVNFFLFNNFVYNTDLKKYQHGSVRKYMRFSNYKSARALARLPLRGQRTQTNAKTCRKFTLK